MTDTSIVVGVGASAGGLNSFKPFFEAIKGNKQLAIVLVLHLDLEYESYLPDILSELTDLEIVKVVTNLPLKAGYLYLCPGNKVVNIHNNRFVISELTAQSDRLNIIDHFYASLAENYAERSIAVILSGKGRDGCIGIETIKENGGMVLVQDPASAVYSDMPRAAIQSGLVDYVLSIEKIGEKLNSVIDSVGEELSEQHNNQLQIDKILTLLQQNTGHDFSGYKESTVGRRIKRLMLVKNCSTFDEYYEFLKNDVKQSELLFKELLIGVTCFFRDAGAFHALEELVIKPMFTQKKDGDQIRIWVAGCSTGEETYSIAMLCQKYIELYPKISVQIFATDINYRALEIARKGIYAKEIKEQVPVDLLTKYFEVTNDKYRVKKEIRDLVVFSAQSLVKDPPFSRIDLISCRNVLIYLGSEVQKKVLSIFNFSLLSGGYLFLGSAENIGNYSNYFTVLDKNSKLYKTTGNQLAGSFAACYSRFKPAINLSSESTIPHILNALSHRELVEKILLDQFVPVAVLVDEFAKMVYSYGKNSSYLETPQGDASLNVLSMVKEGLKIPLTTLFKHAVETQCKQSVERVLFKNSSEIRLVCLSVIPAGSFGEKSYYLIVFENSNLNESFEELKLDVGQQKDNYILRLEEELAITREYLFRANEELDASNEELKSANEELISANEELQSSNEELETSKEELEAMNEDLMALNGEIDNKNSELVQRNYDLDNLFNNLQVGIVYLNRNLHIIRFTRDVGRVINLIAGDIGKPITHIVNNFINNPSFGSDLYTVVQNGCLIEKEVELVDGSVYWMRMIPYRNQLQAVEGLVVTFSDITTLHKADLALKLSEKKYLETIEFLPIGVYEMSIDGRFTYGNACAFDYFGFTAADLQNGIFVQDLFDEQSRSNGIKDLRSLVETGVSAQRPFYLVHDKAGRVFPVEVHSSLIKNLQNQVIGLRGAILDVTEKLKGEEERQKNNRLESIGVLAGGIAHDFNNILTAILGNISLSRYQLKDNEKVAALLLESEKATLRARNLTNQLLTFAKGGSPVLSRSSVKQFIEDAAKFVMLGSNCTLKFDLADKLWLVEVDKDQIGQVLQNLVINATQAMPNGGEVVVSVQNRAVEKNNQFALPAGNYLAITVTDAGCGIEPQLLEKIFDPYFTTKATGTGLGLSICHSVLKKHHGTISVSSKINSGTVFSILLPALDEELSKPSSANVVKVSKPKQKILYMDDELMLRSLAKELFSMYGASVDLAEDGEEAIKMYVDAWERGCKYDLVILDLTVPGKKGGVESLRELQVVDPAVNAVLASGYANSAELRDYRHYGFVNVLSKPFSRDEAAALLSDFRDQAVE